MSMGRIQVTIVDFICLLGVVSCGVPFFSRNSRLGDLVDDADDSNPKLGDLMSARGGAVDNGSVVVENVSYQAHFRRQNGEF